MCKYYSKGQLKTLNVTYQILGLAYGVKDTVTCIWLDVTIKCFLLPQTLAVVWLVLVIMLLYIPAVVECNRVYLFKYCTQVQI